MEIDRVDRIARALAAAPTRRGLARLAAAGVLAAAVRDEAVGQARRCQPKCKPCQSCRAGTCKPRKRDRRCAGPCVVCRAGTCQPKAAGTPCGSDKICEDRRCVRPRCGTGGPCRVFLTEESFNGAMTEFGGAPGAGGLGAADAHCQRLAAAAGLPGTYKAWLAGDGAPANRFTNRNAAGPYQLVPNAGDGDNPPPTVAANFADLVGCGGGGCLQNAINRTQTGSVQGGQPSAWTGTLPNGTTGSANCGGFVSTTGNGLFGVATAVDDRWTNAGTFGCDSFLPLYCFEQA